MASSASLYTLPTRDTRRGSSSNQRAQSGEVIPFMTTRMIADAWAKGETHSSRATSSKSKSQHRASTQSTRQSSGRTRAAASRNAKASTHRAHKAASRTTSAFSRLLVKLLVPVACLALAIGILYPVAKDYYISNYTVQKLQGEYDALSERNSTMEEQISWLKSDEGVSYCARELYGMVAEGETVLNVTGYNGTSEMTVLPEAVTAGSYEPEVGFFGSLAQRIFGVK